MAGSARGARRFDGGSRLNARRSHPGGHARSTILIGVLVAGPLIAIAIAVWMPRSTEALADTCPSPNACRAEIRLSTGGFISYQRSLSLIRNGTVTRAVVVVHGNRRDADRYFRHTYTAAEAEGRLGDMALIAPYFRTSKDRPAPREHYWSSHGWKIGNKSRDEARVSSFAVMDELLARVCSDRPLIFPQLDTVVVVGHSAGGQFVNRYAAGGAGCPNPAVAVRYVVMNPSSYLYVDGRRRSSTESTFAIPEPGCPDYDEYKYGLQDLSAYMEDVGIERIRRQLFQRSVFYLAGTGDTTARGSLDTRCEANLQGPNRLARHANYQRYAGLFEDWTGSVFLTVPDIGHDAGKMLMSDAVRRIVFR